MNSQYHEALAALRSIVNVREGKVDKKADTRLNLRELFDQSRKVALLTHPAELVKHKANVLSLSSDLEVKELELQTLSGLVEEAQS